MAELRSKRKSLGIANGPAAAAATGGGRRAGASSHGRRELNSLALRRLGSCAAEPGAAAQLWYRRVWKAIEIRTRERLFGV